MIAGPALEMPKIIVCSLARVPDMMDVHAPAAMITLLDPASMIDTPAPLTPDRHLRVGVNDIPDEAEGLVAPGPDHVRDIISFVDRWDQTAPLLVHCWAGISRSTATAFIAACRLNPGVSEHEIAAMLRAKAPSASPNPLLVGWADAALGRDGRMVAAVAAIGRGAMVWEGSPFELPVRLG
jgi:predicted protein tyrosine phosphatase